MREPQWNTQKMDQLNVLPFNIPTMRFNNNRLTSIQQQQQQQQQQQHSIP